MAVTRAWLEGSLPVPGSARLIVFRWLLWILSAAPGVAMAIGAIGGSVGNRPYFADAADPLPMVTLGKLLGSIPGPVWATLAVGAGLVWILNLILTAGAIDILNPSKEGKVRVWRTVFDSGSRFLWTYFRIAFLALVLILIGSRVLVVVFGQITDHGRIAGWSAKTVLWTIPLIRNLLFLGWAGLVGILAWWCRVIAVSDGRRYVRRIPALVTRAWLRHPLQGVLFQLVLYGVSLILGAAVLVAWRQSASSTGGWVLLWLLVLLFQSYLWHWRLRVCRLIWATPTFDAARRLPDSPWRVLRRLWNRLARRRKPATPEGPPQVAAGR
jgi:hypothetical protein